MKNKLFFSIGLAILLLSATTVFGQRGRNAERPRNEPRQECLVENLTPEQEAKIQQLRTAQLENRLKHRSQMDELRARQRTLMLEKNPDMNAVNAVVDQMTALRGEMMKEAIKHRQEVRSQLTDEQRVQFDARAPRGPRQQHFQGRPGQRGRR
jgi:Spy/CpxP family protein refolding chaperone